jgi:hypothetical protein
VTALGVGFGSYLQRVSSQRQQEATAAAAADSKKETDRELLAKFDEIKAMLKTASEAPPGPEQQQQIVNISKEFKTWATFFDANRPELARSIDQSRSELSAQRLAEIKAPLEFFTALLDDLRQTVAAYNATSGNSPLDFEIPKIQADALGDPLSPDTTNWTGKIVYSKNTSWLLVVQQSSPGSFTFFASDRFGEKATQRGDLQINLRAGMWTTGSFGSYFDPFPKTNVTFQLGNRDALRDVLQQWFQTQVLLTAREPR